MPQATISTRFLYLPMEIASRELDSRLLIAYFAARAGMEVVMGPKWMLQKNVAAMPKGFWIFKTLTPNDSRRMARVAKHGHKIAAIDEEMPGLGDGSQRLRWVSERSVEAVTAVFCLGDEHAASMRRSFPDHAGKLVVTGNPRWDFLRPELRPIYDQDAADIRATYGRFLLINTNIGLINSAKNSVEGLVGSLTKDGRIDLTRADDRAFIQDLQDFEKANFAAAPPLVKRLAAAFPDHRIVLRPHPTEKLEPYEAALAGVERVDIVREGPAAAWLSAADLLIHTSCTTATEAFALDRPSICYQTIPSALHSYFLSGALSTVATDEDQVIEKARAILAGGLDPTAREAQRAHFERFFAAQDGPLAAERIAGHVAEATGAALPAAGAPAEWKPSWLFRRKWRPSKFQQRIFPKFGAGDIETRMRQLVATLGRDETPAVTQVGDNQFHLRMDVADVRRSAEPAARRTAPALSS